MPKDSHVGKNPRQYQQYFEALSNQPTLPTDRDDELTLSTEASDVSIVSEEKVTKRPTQKRRQRKYGLNKHFHNYLATYLVGAIFGFGAIAVVLYLSLGLPSYGEIREISNQIDNQKLLNSSLIDDLQKLEDTLIFSNSEIKSQLQEINMKLQEQALKFELLDQFINLTQP